jgi:inositol-phosphate phosphatase / L-galactose 1-phosphate phosphatase
VRGRGSVFFFTGHAAHRLVFLSFSFSPSLNPQLSTLHTTGAVIKAAFRPSPGAAARADASSTAATTKANDRDLVTATDGAAEAAVRAALAAVFPAHAFIGEEEAAAAASRGDGPPVLTDDPTWIVDPLDGTTNFVHGFPAVAVSIALAIGGQPVVGVVFNPVTDELFAASRGRGATRNGEPCAPSPVADLSSALIGTEIGVSRDPAVGAAVFSRAAALTSAARSLRCGGSCALGLCAVACGRLDVFYEIGFGGAWDVAAGAVIVREAGGEVLDPAGGVFGLMARRVLAGAPGVAAAAADVLAGAGLAEGEPPVPAG